MNTSSYLQAIRDDGDRLAAAAELGLEAAVPSCPGWTVADLVGHTGVVHRHKTEIVKDGWIDAMPEPVTAPEDGLIPWYRTGLDEMLDVLSTHEPDERVATWYPEDQSVGFWIRRMACETVVHRIDAELAHGVVTDVDPALAGDATDEIIRVFMAGYPEWADLSFGDRSVRVEATDTGHTWTLRHVTFSGTSPHTGNEFDEEPTFVFADIAQPTSVVSGAAEDLLLFLWGRRGSEGLAVSGDPQLLDDLRRVAEDVTQ